VGSFPCAIAERVRSSDADRALIGRGVNILLVQLKRIGDLILTVPAITAVRRQHPDARISLLVAHGGGALLPAIASIDRGFVMHSNLADLKNWFALVRGGFDACVDFTHTDRSAFFVVMSRSRRRITPRYVELQSRFRAKWYNEYVDAPVREMHTIDKHLAFVEPLGVREASREIELTIPPEVNARAAKLASGEFVLIHPGSARAEKFWEPKRWAAVIDRIQSTSGLRCVITGGTSRFEQEQIAAIKSQHETPVLDLSGKTNLLELAALVQRARLLLTVDSAPMHFAAAFHTPQVALFGPTNPFHWRPFSRNAVVLQGDSGKPLTEFAPHQPRHSMSAISTGAVIDAMESLLSATAAARL
jgi:predicted lipopolysaccharide heptosyltransferase III